MIQAVKLTSFYLTCHQVLLMRLGSACKDQPFQSLWLWPYSLMTRTLTGPPITCSQCFTPSPNPMHQNLGCPHIENKLLKRGKNKPTLLQNLYHVPMHTQRWLGCNFGGVSNYNYIKKTQRS
jgi:hypothetical protein